MTVSPPTLPDFTSQTATAYKTAIDGSSAVHGRYGQWFAPHEEASPAMTARLEAGFIWTGTGIPVVVAAQSTAPINAPTTNPRKDIVYVDVATGTVGVATGTEAASPSDPTIPNAKIPIARVNLVVSQISILDADLDDLRPFPGGGNGGAWDLIERGEITASTAQVDVTAGTWSDYDEIEIMIGGLRTSLAGFVSIGLFIGGTLNTTATYETLQYGVKQSAPTVMIVEQHPTKTSFELGILLASASFIGNVSGDSVDGTIRLHNINATGFKEMTYHLFSNAFGSLGEWGDANGGGTFRTSTAAMTGVRIKGTAGNIDHLLYQVRGRIKT